jgi:large subunit ribosomal protein L13
MNKLNKTFLPSKEYETPTWHSIDCKGQKLGRLATLIAILLRGKRKPHYHPSSQFKDHIILLNADLIIINPTTEHHLVNNPGRPGSSLKIKKASDSLPKFTIERSVRGMLSASETRHLMRQLYIYPDTNHPHTAQKVTELNLKDYGFEIEND